jgi:hypothetical protein
MVKVLSFSPVVRAILVMGAVAAVVTGVTFAALTSNTATLAENTINSATASLQISSDGGCGPSSGTFGTSDNGFDFNGLIPGGSASPNETFCLKNTGTADLALKAFVPVVPTWTVLPSGTVDPGEVDVHMSCDSSAGTLDARLQDLGSSAQAFASSTLAAGATAVCTVNVDMNAAAFSGSSASSSDFDFEFTGEAVESV